MKTPHVNRRKTQQPRLSGGYCCGCDRNWVMDGVKCGICGSVNGKRRRYRKVPPSIEEFD